MRLLCLLLGLLALPPLDPAAAQPRFARTADMTGLGALPGTSDHAGAGLRGAAVVAGGVSPNQVNQTARAWLLATAADSRLGLPAVALPDLSVRRYRHDLPHAQVGRQRVERAVFHGVGLPGGMHPVHPEPARLLLGDGTGLPRHGRRPGLLRKRHELHQFEPDAVARLLRDPLPAGDHT